MKILLVVVLLGCASVTALGQYFTASPNSIRFQNRPAGFITALPPAPPTTKGDGYLYRDFHRTNIFLKDSTVISEVFTRLDLKANCLEIQHSGETKILPFDRVLKIALDKNGAVEEFYSSRVLNYPDKTFRGLFQILSVGRVLLLSSVRPEVVKADYNAALDVGRRDNEVVLKTHYYILKGDAWIHVGSKRNFKRQIIGVFGDKAAELVEDTNLKKLNELVQLATELNKLS